MFIGAGFTPASLFSNAEPGAWYDPSDLTTLFQDTAGTTPVTAPGQTVGLMLDKSQGLPLGPQLVTNGDFSNGTTGWPLTGGTATVTASGGGLTVNATVTAFVTQSFSTVVGGTYAYSVEIVSQNSAAFNAIRKADNNTASVNVVELRQGIANGPGTSTGVFVATASTTFIVIQANSGAVITVDNISVKLLPGNYATQATAASRPTYGIVPLGGRRNLLTWSEDFTNVVWAKTGTTVTADAEIAPNGELTADRANNTGVSPIFSPGVVASVGQGLVFSVWLKSATGANQTVNLSIAGASNTAFTVTGTWQRFSVVWANPTAGTWNGRIGTTAQLYDVYLWGAQLEVGSTATAYQRVTTQFNVTQTGTTSLSYLSFDGVDDGMVTSTVTPGTDKVQVFSGVRKLSDAAVGRLVELSATSASNNGVFTIAAPTTSSTDYFGQSKGTVASFVSATPYVAPTTNVVTLLGDISADVVQIRVNSTLASSSATDQGTGNYLAYPLYIGRRGGTTQPFNGQIYSLIVRFGANLDNTTITRTENWVNGETGAY